MTWEKGVNHIFPLYIHRPLKQSATFNHNRIIYVALRLPETKGNDFPVFFRINNFLLYGGGQHYVLQVKYFKL